MRRFKGFQNVGHFDLLIHQTIIFFRKIKKGQCKVASDQVQLKSIQLKGFHDVGHFDLFIHQTGIFFANLGKVDVRMHQTKFG